MMSTHSETLDRAHLLLGSTKLRDIQSRRIILFGVGGVGSWCAEALIRSGVEHLTIVDFDKVSASNVNRQLPATIETIGQIKVEAMRNRLASINPDAEIEALDIRYNSETAEQFDFDQYDVVIDCIDSVADKALLILRATASKASFYSSMGAALRFDPTKVAVAEFWKVSGCPLARALRQRFKKNGVFPKRKFLCVYSTEPAGKNVEEISGDQPGTTAKQPNGSLVQITAVFGMNLAALVLNA